jgi:hypothetical protein
MKKRHCCEGRGRHTSLLKTGSGVPKVAEGGREGVVCMGDPSSKECCSVALPPLALGSVNRMRKQGVHKVMELIYIFLAVNIKFIHVDSKGF